jgi:hypothetical protein
VESQALVAIPQVGGSKLLDSTKPVVERRPVKLEVFCGGLRVAR